MMLSITVQNSTGSVIFLNLAIEAWPTDIGA
ncbi:hypothetical protein ACVJBD_001884 [Rhizobium mongolense]